MTAPLIARQLVRRFGDEPAVSGVDLTVRYGEIHALVGLNGAGKTTLMRLLLGMLRPDAGKALVFGAPARATPATAWRKVGHLIEAPFAYQELTVRENLHASALLQQIDRSAAADSVERVIGEFGLEHWADGRAATLSQGNRQRLGLAAAFVADPSVLVLDEPANSLDPAGVVFTRDLLRFHADNGSAVLVSSHHFDQLARVADVITVLHRGQVVGSLDPGGADLEQSFFDIVHGHDLEMGVVR